MQRNLPMTHPTCVPLRRLPGTALAIGMVAATGLAQCGAWLPGSGIPGVNGAYGQAPIVETWDPDGPGGAPELFVFGGNFNVAGEVAAYGLATYQPVSGTWTSLGLGFQSSVRAIGSLANGDLVVSGELWNTAGYPILGIGRWHGSSWSALGPVGHTASAFVTLPNGDLVAAGTFAGGIARWDGSAWQPFGSGPSVATGWSISSLVVMPNGDLIAGGRFTPPGGIQHSLARWDGATWSHFGTTTFSAANSLRITANGDLVVCGDARVGRWDGSTWTMLGSGMTNPPGPFGSTNPAYVNCIELLPNGDIVAGGNFQHADGVPANNIALWNGSSWAALDTGTGNDVIDIASTASGDLVATGRFTSAGTARVVNVAMWTGGAWSAVNGGFDAQVGALMSTADGELVAAGNFAVAGGVPSPCVAKRVGTTWTPLTGGTALSANPGNGLRALTELSNGHLIAAGDFGIFLWDGTAWTSIATGPMNGVRAVLALPNDDVIAGGGFTTSYWYPIGDRISLRHGGTWQPLGTGMDDTVTALTRMANGDVIAGGRFTSAGGVAANRIARWDGTAWLSLGTGMNNVVTALVTLPTGDLVAGGVFTTAGGVNASYLARWDGTSWSEFGGGVAGPVYSLAVLPNGDLVVGGQFIAAGGVPANSLARWNGSSWSPFDGGVDGSVNALAALPRGELAVGGVFANANGAISAFFATYASTCPATAAAFGTPCSSSAGAMLLTSSALPWLGSRYRYRCSGMASTSLAVTVFGFTAGATPLAALHPAGIAGCDLLVAPDSLGLLLPSGGEVTGELLVPASTALISAVLHHQVLQVELGAGAAITQLGGSNGQTLTIGSF